MDFLHRGWRSPSFETRFGQSSIVPFGIALALALVAKEPASAQPAGWVATGRIVDGPSFHLGVRPAVFFDGTEVDVGVTIQVSLKVL